MEAINKLVGQQIYKYVQDNNIQMLGEPLPSEKQEPADLENGTSFTFMFDIAVAPEFKVTLNGRDKVDYYIPRPAMLVAMVTAPCTPASATISASSSWNFAFRTLC